MARVLGNASQSGVSRALRRLVRQGIVDAAEAGPALLYTLNRDHLGAPAVRTLSGLRAMLIERLRETIAAWPLPPRHASLFGSAARGDGTAQSDIDLFVVRASRVAEDEPRWREQLDELASLATRWTGNRVAISEVSTREVRRLRETRPAIVDELLRDAITLAGRPLAAIVS